MRFKQKLLLLLSTLGLIVLPRISEGLPPAAAPTATLLIAGLAGGSGSTVGPGGALYVAEPFAGRVSRVDPETGAVETFASGLPAAIVRAPQDLQAAGDGSWAAGRVDEGSSGNAGHQEGAGGEWDSDGPGP